MDRPALTLGHLTAVAGGRVGALVLASVRVAVALRAALGAAVAAPVATATSPAVLPSIRGIPSRVPTARGLLRAIGGVNLTIQGTLRLLVQGVDLLLQLVRTSKKALIQLGGE